MTQADHVEVVDKNGKALAAFGDEEKLPVDAVSIDEATHVARVHGYAFTAPFSVTPSGPDVEFFYVVNDSATDQMVIEQIQIQDAGAETLIVASCTGTPSGTPTEITPTNRLRGSTNTADVTVYEKATITGLTITAVVKKAVAAAADVGLLEEPIILRPSQALCVSAVTGTAAVVGTCYFYQAKHPLV
jgi:hypothetical protein